MSETIIANDGTSVPVNDLPVTIGYTDGLVTTLTYIYANQTTGLPTTYVQTITRDGNGNATAISRLVAQ
jgi:hypothetical protein